MLPSVGGKLGGPLSLKKVTRHAVKSTVAWTMLCWLPALHSSDAVVLFEVSRPQRRTEQWGSASALGSEEESIGNRDIRFEGGMLQKFLGGDKVNEEM